VLCRNAGFECDPCQHTQSGFARHCRVGRRATWQPRALVWFGSRCCGPPSPPERYMSSMNGSTAGPSSATMNETFCVISPRMKCTSRLRRSSLAMTIEHLRRLASCSAAASCGRRGADRASLNEVGSSCHLGSLRRLRPTVVALAKSVLSSGLRAAFDVGD